MITTSMIYKNTKRLNETPDLLDVAMECADFLEQTGAFAYKNWEYAEVVSGVTVVDYYVAITLMFPKSKTPDPLYIERITRLECLVTMKEDTYRRSKTVKTENKSNPFEKIVVEHKVWLIEIKIPQRFLALDGNTLFNIDGKDIYYDDLDIEYDIDAEASDDSEDSNMGDMDDAEGW